ncbi:transporter [Pseudomonadota bacterium]
MITLRVWGVFVMLVSALFSVQAIAQLNGHNLRGDYGVASGSQPPPGSYLSPFYINYDVDALRDRNGDRVDRGGGLDVEGFALIYQWVSEKQLFGGNYSVLVAPSWTTNSLDSPFLETDLVTSWGLGDLYIQPVNLGWHKDRADYVAGIGIFAPTGEFTDGASDNTGLGMWTFEVFAGTTVFLDEAKSWHFATTAFWETHSEKEDSDQKVGNLLTLEGGLGKSLKGGAITLGLVYFAQWKLSADDLGTAGPADVSLNKHQVFGVGPELTFALTRQQKPFGFVNMRYLADFGAESMTEGNTFTLAVTFPLGG